jgi:DNA-binding NtrC family response regulator
MGFSVVILESDAKVAQSLAGKLSSHFHAVHLTRSGDELRKHVVTNHPEVVILDMEYSLLTDVQNLRQDFPTLPIVCTHRIPDEHFWVEAMDAGASDVCRADDVQTVVTSALRGVAMAQSAAA